MRKMLQKCSAGRGGGALGVGSASVACSVLVQREGGEDVGPRRENLQLVNDGGQRAGGFTSDV